MYAGWGVNSATASGSWNKPQKAKHWWLVEDVSEFLVSPVSFCDEHLRSETAHNTSESNFWKFFHLQRLSAVLQRMIKPWGGMHKPGAQNTENTHVVWFACSGLGGEMP